MSYNQNLGGEKPSFAKGLRLRLEGTPFQEDPNAAPILAADVDDYFAVNHIKNRKSVKVQGDNQNRTSVLQRARTEVPSMGIYPDYLQMFKWLWMTFQIHGKTTANGVDVYEFRKPRRGIPKTGTATIEAGEESCADKAVGAAVQEFELSSGAESDPTASVSLVAAEAVRGVPMSGAVARNHKFRINAANVAGPLGLSIVVPGVAQAKTVNLAIGMTKAQIEAEFAAQGLTAVSTGSIAVGAGKSQVITGNGNALSIGGVNVDLTTPETVAALVARIKTANPARNTLAGTGTINKAIAGLSQGSDALILSQGNVSQFGGSAGTYKAVATYTDGAGTRKISPVLNLTLNQGVAYNLNFGSGTPSFTSIQYYLSDGPGSDTLKAIGAVVNSQGVDLQQPGSGVVAPVANTGTLASVVITLSDNASAGNAADLPVVGAGYNSASTAPGGAGGIVDVEVTNPGKIFLGVSKATGDAGYVVTTIAAGSNGKVEPLPAFPFAASDWVLGRAASLDAIDAATLAGVVKYAFKVANCVMPRSTANGTRTHSVVKKGTYDITLDFTIDDDTTAARDGQLDAIIKEADETTNKVSKPSWYQVHSRADEQHWLKIQSWMHVKSDLNASADEDASVYDIQLEENGYSPQEFSSRILLAVPQGTFAI